MDAPAGEAGDGGVHAMQARGGARGLAADHTENAQQRADRSRPIQLA